MLWKHEWQVFPQLFYKFSQTFMGVSPPGGGGGTPQKIGGDVRPASQNPYPIYE